jgi:hypothetical protein
MPIPLLGPLFNLITQLLSSKAKREERRIEAGIKFRNIFLDELADLYPEPANWPKAFGIEPRLKKSYKALQSAVIAYRPFVSDKAAFDDAWIWYHASTKRAKDQAYDHYLNITSVSPGAFGAQNVIPNDGKANFKRNIERLLSFAPDI